MVKALWLANALRDFGCHVIEQPGWQNRGSVMAPIWGVIGHHTGGGGNSDWVTVQNGRPGLSGPLANMTLERDGTFRIIASGRCNHAGLGRWPGIPTNDANVRTIGIEGVSNGKDWTPAQREAYPKGVAALLRFLHFNEFRFIGHKEWAPSRKVDPGNWDMNSFRADIRSHLNGTIIQQDPEKPKNLILLGG